MKIALPRALVFASVFAAMYCRGGKPAVIQAAEAPSKPNVIFILADDLGYGDVGCYGQRRIATPKLDAMAAQGMRFTQFYAGDTVCTPSRCVLMTGLHTGHCSMRGNGDEARGFGAPTVATLLKNAGYDTAIFGKWGLANEPQWPGAPNRQGFDEFLGYLNNNHAHNYYPSYLWHNGSKMLLKNVVPNEGPMGSGVASVKAQYSDDLFTEAALQFIDSHKSGPFFLYLPYTIPHANDEAKKKGMEVPDLGPYADTDWPEAEKGFAAMVTRLDDYVGRIFQKLRAEGLDEKTIVFFTSDNGPHAEGGQDPDFFASYGPLRGIKRDLLEGGIREPMIVRWPGHIAPGGVSDFIGGFQDVLPTLTELAGGQTPANLDGLSIVPTLQGRPADQTAHPYLYWEFHEKKGAQAVRAGDWKAIRKPLYNGPITLYNLKEDLHEDHDLAAENPTQVERLRQIMDEAHIPPAEH